MLQYVAVCCSVLQYVAVCCSVLQCVVVCCSMLQCVAVCGSVLQYVAMRMHHPLGGGLSLKFLKGECETVRVADHASKMVMYCCCCVLLHLRPRNISDVVLVLLDQTQT